MAGNEALQVNPPNAVYHISTNGSDWLWTVFAIMTLCDLIVIGWHFAVPRGQRVFHQIAAIVLTTAAIAYFAMASDLGATPIATEFSHHGRIAGVTRQIWYVRYIMFFITTPALLLMLVLASGLALSDIVTLVFFSLVFVVARLVGALVSSTYKWGFFVFSVAGLVYVWWALLGPARTSAKVIGSDYHSAFGVGAGILSFIWLLYPICWGLSEGGNVITPTSEMVFYGILDLLSMPFFLFIHLFALSKLDLAALQLYSGKFSTTAATGAAGVAVQEKAAHPVAGTGTTTAATTNGTGTATGTQKKSGLFSRHGHHDAPAPAATGNTGVAEAPPRVSEATVV
ncbi:Protein FDD123 [Saitozyma sp. JCM 24511]|jgi:bacteriorhodopsin|nr:Protein FDD123 [Saitozyma sp. JCM 24511]